MVSILITAGPTREYLDDVRFLSNGSSGRMGCALAEAALACEHLAVRRTDFEIDYELGGIFIPFLPPGDADRLGIDDDRLVGSKRVVRARLIGSEALGDVLDEQNAAEAERRLVQRLSHGGARAVGGGLRHAEGAAAMAGPA